MTAAGTFGLNSQSFKADSVQKVTEFSELGYPIIAGVSGKSLTQQPFR